MLKRFNFSDVLPMRIAFNPSIHLEKNIGSSVSQVEYAKNNRQCDLSHEVTLILILHMLLVD